MQSSSQSFQKSPQVKGPSSDLSGQPSSGSEQPMGQSAESSAPTMKKWSCRLFDVDENQKSLDLPPSQLTVGKLLSLDCEGQPVDWGSGSLRLVKSQEQKYDLQLLKVMQQTDTQLRLLVTSWKSGDILFQDLHIRSDASEVSLGEVRFQVASVLKSDATQEQKPFGPWGAISLPLPQYLWLAIAFLAFVLLAVCGFVVRKRTLRRRFLMELEKHAIVGTAYNQFNKVLRSISRQYFTKQSLWNSERALTCLADIERGMRWYLARELMLPVHRGSAKALMKQMNSAYPKIIKLVGKDINLAFVEFAQATTTKKNISIQDATQLIELCRKIADTVRDQKAFHEKGGG